MDHVGRRRKSSTGPRIEGVVAGSVWESRMKLDEVKGGIKVFNGEENDDDCTNNSVGNDEKLDSTTTSTENMSSAIVPVLEMDKKVILRAKQSPSGKRKTWKSESLEGSPIQIAKQRSEMVKINLDEQCKELSVSGDGLIKKSPVQKKTISGSIKEMMSVSSVDHGIEKSPIQTMKSRSVSQKVASGGESSDGIEKNSIQLRKAKSESIKVSDDSGNGNSMNSLQLVEEKSVSTKEFQDNGEISKGIGTNSVKLQKRQFDKQVVGSNESTEGIEKCEEKIITSNEGNVNQIKKFPPKADNADDLEDEFEEIEVETEKKSLIVKEINVEEQKPKKLVIEENKFVHINERKVPIPSILNKQSPPVINHAKVHPNPTKSKPIPVSDGFQRIPRRHSKLQSFVELVMWRDVSKSAFVFGIGTFFIFSSSYTKDLNISLISVLSYLGLVYLAAIFLFRSFITRGGNNLDDSSMEYVVGEEEADWFIKLVLPYINEFLLKLKALFSGDPATTLKMAVVLFILAKCGSSITILKMAKLCFFGVFIVPKVCSSYSTQIAAYGIFWIRRFRDGWEKCSHKKAVAFAIFTLVWNLSSIVARIWMVFMLFVVFRYYQHKMVKEGWVKEEPRVEDTSKAQNEGPNYRPRRRPIMIETEKQQRSF